ncbi:hypothetical protein HELRODRAFT_173785 [Helobdella robusta]|uniref:ZZ-type domain-containing protein n=1 Tax=Helobdella robusta TaxID=6412 RepID=T1F782_HELRO|nr:hypothetical protein HELRODRAFT_173785 [Helobdella robusta]ESO03481.1 hypothetical protein HELRODRAFT_173785 [Helobdella robusta]
MEIDDCQPPAEICQKCREALNERFIKCTQCPNSLILCLKCFSQGEELESHDNSHDYEVHSKNSVRLMLFGDRWTVEEESSLLEAVEHFGFGKCEEHYLLYYVDGSIGKS